MRLSAATAVEDCWDMRDCCLQPGVQRADLAGLAASLGVRQCSPLPPKPSQRAAVHLYACCVRTAQGAGVIYGATLNSLASCLRVFGMEAAHATEALSRAAAKLRRSEAAAMATAAATGCDVRACDGLGQHVLRGAPTHLARGSCRGAHRRGACSPGMSGRAVFGAAAVGLMLADALLDSPTLPASAKTQPVRVVQAALHDVWAALQEWLTSTHEHGTTPQLLAELRACEQALCVCKLLVTSPSAPPHAVACAAVQPRICYAMQRRCAGDAELHANACAVRVTAEMQQAALASARLVCGSPHEALQHVDACNEYELRSLAIQPSLSLSQLQEGAASLPLHTNSQLDTNSAASSRSTVSTAAFVAPAKIHGGGGQCGASFLSCPCKCAPRGTLRAAAPVGDMCGTAKRHAAAA